MGIRWNKGDYIRLGKAVSEFNKEISKNQSLTNELALPEKINYRDLRDSIQTREGLNDYIESLKNIKLPGAFTPAQLEGGEIITTYQKREMDTAKNKTIKSIQNEVNKLEAETKANLQIDDDIKLPNAFKSQEQKMLEARIRDYKRLYSLSGRDFKRLSRELGISETERKYRRAYIFRQNYINEFKKYSNFAYYKEWQKWAYKHRNPLNFYDSLPDNEYYPDDLNYQSDNTMSEQQFNRFLESLGIDLQMSGSSRIK